MKTIRDFCAVLLVLLLMPFGLLFAQAMPDGGEAATVPLCVIYGPLIAALMQTVKKLPIVQRNTTLITAIASAVLSLYPVLGHLGETPLVQILVCLLATFGGATLTHRALVKPIEREIGNAGKSVSARALDILERLVPHAIDQLLPQPSAPAPRPRRR